MNVLCVGDIVGDGGTSFFCESIPYLKREYNVDFVIANGENSEESGNSISRNTAQILLQFADVVTTGNHCFRRASPEVYETSQGLLCPANYPGLSAKLGCCTVDLGRRGSIRVINLAGVAWMEPLDNPFFKVDQLLQTGSAKFTVVDFHAESTAEKKAFAYYLDGRVSAVFGTHTHVQTADEQILPNGTGYITDVGMTGPENSVIGVHPQNAVDKQRLHIPVQFKVAQGLPMLNGVLFTLDDATGLCTKTQRILHRPFAKKTP